MGQFLSEDVSNIDSSANPVEVGADEKTFPVGIKPPVNISIFLTPVFGAIFSAEM